MDGFCIYLWHLPSFCAANKNIYSSITQLPLLLAVHQRNLNVLIISEFDFYLLVLSLGSDSIWEKEICLENALHIHAWLWRGFWSHGSCFAYICPKVSRKAGLLFYFNVSLYIYMYACVCVGVTVYNSCELSFSSFACLPCRKNIWTEQKEFSNFPINDCRLGTL